MRLEQRELWEKFYSGDSQVFFPSEFAKSVLPELEKGCALLDVGCGNGRDSVFFAENDINVTAIDLSMEAIARLKKKSAQVRAVCDNVLTSSIFTEAEYDAVYSRFFIHALTEAEESELLKRCYKAIKTGGKLFVETRCTQDELCGRGERISDTEWSDNGHYRRFVVPDKMVEKLIKTGFKNIGSICSRGFAPFNGSDPVVLRITAQK